MINDDGGGGDLIMATWNGEANKGSTVTTKASDRC